MIAELAYHTIPTAGPGLPADNYDESSRGYDMSGRVNRRVSPGGTITRTTFDALGRTIGSYVGTADNGATDSDPTGGGVQGNNMVQVIGRTYSADCDCSQPSQLTEFVDGNSVNNRVTNYVSDFRNRQIQITDPLSTITQATYDNLNYVTMLDRYYPSVSSGNLIARSQSFYDNQGRVYQTWRWVNNVLTDPTSPKLIDNTWYDESGNVIEQLSSGSQAFRKNQYDGMGRNYANYVGYVPDSGSEDYIQAGCVGTQPGRVAVILTQPWDGTTLAATVLVSATAGSWTLDGNPLSYSASAASVASALGLSGSDTCVLTTSGGVSQYAITVSSSDKTSALVDWTVGSLTISTTNKIFEQTITIYDDAGNVVEVDGFQRFHNAPATAYGPLNPPRSGADPLARVMYQANYFDGVGRQIGVANFGTNGDASFTRPDSLPEVSDSVLVTSYGYDQAGNQNLTTDPAGLVTLQTFNALGKPISTISNYTGGSPGNDTDVTVRMQYNGDGNLIALTACNPTTGDQTTRWEYGVVLDPTLATEFLEPSQIPGWILGLDANVGVMKSDGAPAGNGDPVTDWADQSGNGNNATVSDTSPTYALAAINGRAAVSFDFVDNAMTTALLNLNSPFTIMAVEQPLPNLTDAQYRRTVQSLTANSMILGGQRIGDSYDAQFFGTVISSGHGVDDGTTVVEVFRVDSDSNYRMNGVDVTDYPSQTGDWGWVGLGKAGYGEPGGTQLACVHVFDRRLTDAETLALERWAMNTYFQSTGSALASNDLLRSTIYPDAVDSLDRVMYAYNRQGQRISQTDQNGTAHNYNYDPVGRQTSDSISAFGSGIDTTVQQINRTYDANGQVLTVTSQELDGSVVNEVSYTYNYLQQLTTEYQQHGGAVDTSTSPKVQYAYASGSANTVRPTSITYPGGASAPRVVNYDYGTSGGDADLLSRIASLIDISGTPTTLVSYTYIGLGTIVQANSPQPSLTWTLIIAGDMYNPYGGFDQFGRVIDCLWNGASTALDEIKYGYDRASNRIWRKDPVASSQSMPVYQDELYNYDGLQRLTDMGAES